MKQCTILTKQVAYNKLTKAGYSATIERDGLSVTGNAWAVFYSDRGQDYNSYTGNVPPEVDDLAVWDEPEARE